MAVAFDLFTPTNVTAPVVIKVPVDTPAGTTTQKFVHRHAYVTFRLPTEDEVDEVVQQAERHNRAVVNRIAELEKERDGKPTDAGRQKIDAKIDAERRTLRSFQNEQLKAFIVGLPDDSGFADGGKPAVYSAELVERLCQFRPIRAALWAAFLTLLNGPDKA